MLKKENVEKNATTNMCACFFLYLIQNVHWRLKCARSWSRTLCVWVCIQWRRIKKTHRFESEIGRFWSDCNEVLLSRAHTVQPCTHITYTRHHHHNNNENVHTVLSSELACMEKNGNRNVCCVCKGKERRREREKKLTPNRKGDSK